MDRPYLEAERSGTTISSLASDCTSDFLLCVVNSSDHDIDAITDAQGRFNVWAANLGALQPPQSPKSLDFRLKDAETMENSVVSGLERLSGVQTRISRILAGVQPNRREPEVALGVNPGSSEPLVDEFHELVLNMTTCLDHLFGLSILIRRLRPRGRVGQLSLFQPSTNTQRDIVTVIDKFPKARKTPWLAERLGRANDQRRQFFAYRQQHRGQLGTKSKRQEVLSGNDNATLRAATTVATTFEEGDGGPSEPRDIQLDQRSVATAATSFVSDFDDSGQMGRRIPELRDMTLDGVKLDYNKLIECPYCRTIQSFRDHLMWKKHVFSDLQPYVCTFENCNVIPFSTRDDWFQHELDSHRRQWECILCNMPRPTFSRRTQIATHFKDDHEDHVTENQISLIIGACEVSMTAFDTSACPLCSEWVPPSEEVINLREFRRHLARHQQQISLEALPLYVEGLAIQETFVGDDFVHQRGTVLFDSHQLVDSTGPSPKKGDEVLILDMSNENLWRVRVKRTGRECLIPREGVILVGTTVMGVRNSKPDPSKLRTWQARSGLSTVSAMFMGVEDDKILLLRLGGVEIKVPREKLSYQDLAYVDSIIDTDSESEDHKGSDSLPAKNKRSGVGKSLRAALFARIVSYELVEYEVWYIVQALLEDGQTWELTRYLKDFENLHIGLLAEIPSAAGKIKIRDQTPLVKPFSIFIVTEAAMKRQMNELNVYLRDLLNESPLFTTSVAVKQFFEPRDGDAEIDPVDWSELYADSLYYHGDSIGL